MANKPVVAVDPFPSGGSSPSTPPSMQNVCSVSDKLYDKPGQKYLAAGRLVELSLAFGKSGVQLVSIDQTTEAPQSIEERLE